jgi:hypothetical protein
MVLDYNLTLSNDTVAMYVIGQAISLLLLVPSRIVLKMFIARVWRTSSNAAAVAAKGFRFVHAASNAFYLVRLIPLNRHSTFPADPNESTPDGMG